MRYFKFKPGLIRDGIFYGGTYMHPHMKYMLHSNYIIKSISSSTSLVVCHTTKWAIELTDLVEIPEEEATSAGAFHLPYITDDGKPVLIDILNYEAREVSNTSGTYKYSISSLKVPPMYNSNSLQTVFYYRFKRSVLKNPYLKRTRMNRSGQMDYMLHPGYTISLEAPIEEMTDSGGGITHQGYHIAAHDLEEVPTGTVVDRKLTYTLPDGSFTTVDKSDFPSRSSNRDSVNGHRVTNLIPSPTLSKTYYAIDPDIVNGYRPFTTEHTPDMGYMLHPDFRVVLDFRIDAIIDVKYQGFHIHPADLYEKLPDSQVCQYENEEGSPIILPILSESMNVGYHGNTYIGSSTPIVIDRDSFIYRSPARAATSPKKVEWGPTQNYRVSFYNNYLKDQIRTRYAFFERPRDGKKNIIVDSLFPRLIYKYGFSSDTPIPTMRADIPKTAIAISPFCASLLGVQRMEIEQLCLVLGYTKKAIAKLCRDVKKKNKTFVFVGAGGTNINTAHWLTEMCKMSNVQGIFKEVRVFERDTAELSNLLRFPKDPATIRAKASIIGNDKLNIIADDVEYLGRYCEFHRKYIPDSTNKYPPYLYKTTSIRNPDTNALERIETTLRNPENTVLYGAPTIESRDAISKGGNFICATHADSSCSMWLNPKQGDDLNIQIESYGMIQLGTFFVNQLKMAITLLELLASEDLDLSMQDQELLDYSFDGTTIGTTDRVYNWQTLESPTMMTEAEAAQF